MPLRLGNGKAQRHDIEKRWVALRNAPAAEVVTDRKLQLVAADRQRPSADQGRVGAAIGIGDGRRNQMMLPAGQLVELDRDADGRSAAMRETTQTIVSALVRTLR